MKYKIWILLIWLIPGSLHQVKSQVFERSRTETRSFKVFDRTALEVYNKYGNIHLFVWEKDSVRIDIHIDVKASKEQKADRIFEYIDFEFSNSKYYIIARTQFRQSQGSFWSELSDLANTVFNGNNKTQIDYDIYLPANLEVKLENKFGNIYCTNLSGKFSVDLSNGDFRANDLTGLVDLKLEFGNSAIHNISQGNIETGYGELELTNAGEIEIDSKSSEIKCDEAQSIRINSRRDQIDIGKVNAIMGELDFSSISIQSLSNSADITTDYGEIKFNGIKPGFQEIRIQARYTDIYLSLSEKMTADINIDHSASTGIYFPEKLGTLPTEAIDQKNDQYRTKGILGTSAESGKINISIQSGKISFQDENKVF